MSKSTKNALTRSGDYSDDITFLISILAVSNDLSSQFSMAVLHQNIRRSNNQTNTNIHAKKRLIIQTFIKLHCQFVQYL